MYDIKEQIKNLPDKPGVYLHKDKYGKVIYVGKAVSLKNRVRSYFGSQKGMAPKVQALVSNIMEFEYITTDSEMEALILECNLIKKYMPKYNVLLRDDKTYPYIKITLDEEFPRIIKTRNVKNDKCKYFGPYSDVNAVNETIDLLNDIFELKKCSAKSFSAEHTPCLNYHIEKCSGVCTGGMARDEYDKIISQVIDFLQGKDKNILESLKEKMSDAAGKMDYEQAALLRDKILAVEAIMEKQKVVLNTDHDMDILLIARGSEGLDVVLFFVRNGKLSGRESYLVEADNEILNEEIITSFIKQYYTEDMMIPNEIAVDSLPEDKKLLEEWLSNMRGKNVRILKPQKGEKRALMDMAKRDVVEMVRTIDDKVRNQQERINAITSELNKVFGSRGSWRIEAYDISNTSGIDSVGAMVVFNNAKPIRKDYRRFKIKTIEGSNDYASLQEVVYRRFKRALEGAPGFSIMPDLLLIDGGENQVSAVKQVIAAMGLDILIAGMVKDERHRTRGLVFDGKEIKLKDDPVLFRYIGNIQEEVHRFAIDYHRGLRGKHLRTSVLDQIPGIGQKRRNSLLAHFGSIDAIKNATAQQLADVQGMNIRAASSIVDFFKNKNSQERNA